MSNSSGTIWKCRFWFHSCSIQCQVLHLWGFPQHCSCCWPEDHTLINKVIEHWKFSYLLICLFFRMSGSSDLVPLLETSCHIHAAQKMLHATCIIHRRAHLSIIETLKQAFKRRDLHIAPPPNYSHLFKQWTEKPYFLLSSNPYTSWMNTVLLVICQQRCMVSYYSAIINSNKSNFWLGKI